MIVSGYEIRKIRGTREFALVLHVLKLGGSFTTLRLVSEDPAELVRYVNDRADKFGDDYYGGDLRKTVLNMRGAELSGLVAGHSVSIDEWNGVRGFVWADVRGTKGGNINVPVVAYRVKYHEMEFRPGEDTLEVYREYTKLTMALLMENFPLRSVLTMRDGDDGYELPGEPSVDTDGSGELQA